MANSLEAGPRRVVLLLKSQNFKNSAGFALYGSPLRWHKVTAHKPAPKGAPVASHPQAGGDHAPAKHFSDEQWKQLELPPENVNAGSYNKQLGQLKQMSEAGHVTGIVGAQYGTNTYGKKAATVANKLLQLHGSSHQVVPGQKAGEHAAVTQASAEPVAAVAPEPEAGTKPTPPAAGSPDLNQLISEYLADGDSENIEQLLADIDEQMGDQLPPSTKASYDYGWAALKHIQGQGGEAPPAAPALPPHLQKLVADKDLDNKPMASTVQPTHTVTDKTPAGYGPGDAEEPSAPTIAMPAFQEGKSVAGVVQYYEKVAQKVIDMAAAGDAAGLAQLKADGLKLNSKGKVSNTWAGKTGNSKIMLALHEKALEQANGSAPATAAAATATPEPAPVSSAPPEKPKQVIGDAIKQKMAEATASLAGNPEFKEAVAIANAKTSPSKLSQIPWDAQLLPDNNKNAKSHNKQVAKIKAMAEAGDITGLEAFKAGVNTYGQKQTKLAAVALAALKESAPAAAPAPVAITPETKSALIDWAIAGFDDKDPLWPTWKGLSDTESKEIIDAAYAKMDAEPGSLTSQAAAGADAGPKKPSISKAGWDGYIDSLETYAKNSDWAMLQSAAAIDTSSPEGEAAKEYAQALLDFHGHGPKDGDTKAAADGGTLVFKNGRWHKQEQAAPAPTIKKLKPGEAIKVMASVPAKTAKGNKDKFKAMAVAGDVAGLQAFIVGNPGMPASKKVAQALINAMTGGGPAPAASVPTPAPAKPAVAAAPPAPKHAGVESMDAWSQTGPQGGSNPGGKFKDADGVEWYCKFPADDDVAKSEVLAAQLYALAGIAGQDAKLITKGGKLGIASRWTDVKKASSPASLASTDGVQSGFAVDAWLGNWDVVGLGYDNLQIGADGKAVRVDAGGSLQYRAQGGKKAFGHTVTELDSLRDAKINPQSASVFAGMTKADITASVKKVVEVSDDDIFDLVMKYGPGDHENKADLIETLIARKADLLEKFPKAVKKEKAKPKPDPTNLAVKSDQLPQPHDFKNWNGPGKGLSSKDHVNDVNLKAEQDLLAFATKGNLIALKDYHYEAVDKDTGASQGQKPIDQHPSQHVKTYWSDLVATLSYIAYPPEALKKFKSVVAGSVTKVSQAFKSAGYGTTTNKVDANARLAFWIALGHTKPAVALLPAGSQSLEFQSTPAGIPQITTAMKQAAQSAYAGLNSTRLVKRFINGIQSSGTYNDNFRDGKMVTGDGKDAVGMVLDAYAYAADKPEGFEIYKWVSFSGDMGKQLLGAQPGTVFQNPGSMCCSYAPNSTSGFGADRIRIRYAKGAKAVDSFGSGNFSGEKEITTLPGQRFVILSCNKVKCPVKGKERIELDVLMLPPDDGYVAELEANKAKHGIAA